jgi:hypothetical protein
LLNNSLLNLCKIVKYKRFKTFTHKNFHFTQPHNYTTTQIAFKVCNEAIHRYEVIITSYLFTLNIGFCCLFYVAVTLATNSSYPWIIQRTWDFYQGPCVDGAAEVSKPNYKLFCINTHLRF